MPDMQKVTIYTDGACHPNPGKGGWAALLRIQGQDRIISGGEKYSTNNRMELTAAIKALKSLHKPSNIKFYTDSNYLKKGITLWMPNWIKQGWKRKGGTLRNADLWKELHTAAKKHQIKWHWVKAHSTNKNNQRVDRLAVMARKKIR